MIEMYDAICREVTVMHELIVACVTGTLPKRSLETELLPRLSTSVRYIPPSGIQLEHDQLIEMLWSNYGSNQQFRIAVRDIKLCHDFGDHLLVTYTEWQQGAKQSAPPDNVRITTAVLSKPPDIQWLHIHETSLQESVPQQSVQDL